jgi:hypothetical protein
VLGHHWLLISLSLAVCLGVADVAHHADDFERSVCMDVIRFGGVLLLLPAMYYLACISDGHEPD